MVEHRPSKPSVAGSTPVARSKNGHDGARFLIVLEGLKILMVKIAFILLGIVAYIYMGTRLLKMRVRFAAFVYFIFLAIFAIAVVFDNPFFVIGWSILSIAISTVIFIMAR